jgi:hypothetical protein
MRRALLATLLFSSACFNFDTSYAAYCARTGRCDGGVGQGGGSGVGGSSGGGSAGAQGGGNGGGAQGGGNGGGAAQGGGSGGGTSAGGGMATGGGTGTCGGVQCTTPIGGSAFCDAGMCDISCNPTFHRCGFSCVDDTNGAACGPMCISCPNPGGLAVRSCDAGVCDFGCINGFQRCGSQCLQANTAQACGPSCAMCSSPGGGTPFCDAGTCDFNCQAPAVRMGNACISPPTLTFPNLSDVTDPNTFIDARIDPNSPSTLWALDFSGQLLVSNDLAQTAFTVVCRLPGTGLNSTWSGFGERSTARIHLSHAPDRTAYVTSPAVGINQSYYGRVYRADQSVGVCTDVTPFPLNNAYLWTSGLGASLAVAADGTLYEFDGDNSGSRLRRSSDHGATWTPLQPAGSLGAYWAGTLSAGPGPDLLLSVFTGNNSPQGLYLVTDGGTMVNKVSAAIYGQDVTARFSWAVSGAAYANKGVSTTDGFVSANGGLTWTQNPAYGETGDWALDPVSNSGYRLSVYDGGLNIERSADMSVPGWSRLTSAFFAGQGTAGIDRIDAVNGNVAVVVGGRLWVSPDSGASFRKIGTKAPLVGSATLDSIDGARVFLVSSQGGTGAAYESTDKGLTYTLRYTSAALPANFATGGLILITRVNPQNANNVIAWGRSPSNAGSVDQTALVTHDGFITAALGSDTMSYAWGNAFSYSPSSLNTSYFYSGNAIGTLSGATSVNSGDTFISLALTPALPYVWYPSAQVMGDPTYALVFDCTNTNQSFRVNNAFRTTGAIAGLASALGNDVPCAAEAYLNGATWRARVISKSGFLATSDDSGGTFTAVLGSGTLPTCQGRNITSLPSDRNTIFTWCGHDFWVSKTGGTSWTQPTAGQNWVKYGCSLITSLVPTDTNALVTCSDRPPVAIAWP